MDLAMFEGSVDLEKVRHERPAWVERLEQNGSIHNTQVGNTPIALRLVYYVFGFSVIACFIYLLVNGLVNASGLLG
jgi:hypothetical protein